MKKILICGVPFSDNLGDGVIAECLTRFIHHERLGIVKTCDLSFREEIVYNGSKGSRLSSFQLLPSFLRKLFVVLFFFLKFQLKGKGYYSKYMNDVDVVFVGGGQLISDVDVNFPLKIYFLIREAEKRNLPVHLLSVGVSSKWSFLGRVIMRRVFRSQVFKSASVRDELSRNHLEDVFGLTNTQVIPDPALMSSLYYPSYSNEGGLSLALGVADISGLNYSSDKNNKLEDNEFQSIVNMISKANSLGRNVVLFTNGALEDELFLHEKVLPRLKSYELDYTFSPRFSCVSDMVEFIASQESIVSFRLHANIVASSFSVPHFAVGWDRKVDSFFDLQGRSEYSFSSLSSIGSELVNIFDSKFNSNISARSVHNYYCDYFKSKLSDS